MYFVLMHIQFTSSTMASGVVRNDGYLMSSYLFPQGLRVIVTVHIKMLHTMVLNWGLAQRRINRSYLANMIKEWRAEDSHDHTNQVSLFPDLNPL